VIRSISGTGNEAIGSLSEKTAIVIEWNTAKPQLQIFTNHGFLLVDSRARVGRVRLARGDYASLRVAAKGHWTIQLHTAA
jgi:hypothetical protein